MIRAAVSFANQRLGTAILVGREDLVAETARNAGIDLPDGVEITNARLSTRRDAYADYLYARLQRQGYLLPRLRASRQHRPQPLRRLHGGARRCRRARHGPDPQLLDGHGGHPALHRSEARPPRHRRLDRALPRRARCSIADTAVHDMPELRRNWPISRRRRPAWRGGSASMPRVALLAYSTFGNPVGERAEKVREAVGILDGRHVDFEYDGEIGADVALNPQAMAAYPFCRLSGPANVLVMPARHSAAISTRCCRNSAARRCSGRCSSASTGRCRSCRSPRAIPTSPTWRRLPPSAPRDELVLFAEPVGDQRRERVERRFRLGALGLDGSMQQPGAAASVISPMMDVPPTIWPSLLTRTSASKASAHFTKFAEARA